MQNTSITFCKAAKKDVLKAKTESKTKSNLTYLIMLRCVQIRKTARTSNVAQTNELSLTTSSKRLLDNLIEDLGWLIKITKKMRQTDTIYRTMIAYFDAVLENSLLLLLHLNNNARISRSTYFDFVLLRIKEMYEEALTTTRNLQWKSSSWWEECLKG